MNILKDTGLREIAGALKGAGDTRGMDIIPGV